MNLAEVSEFWARRQPEAVAITQGGVALTYAELEKRTRRIAAGLLDRGVQAGDRVGVLGTNSLAWCELALGILRAGAVLVPLNVRSASSELAYMIDHVGLSAIAYDKPMSEKYAPLAVERARLTQISLDDIAEAEITMASLREFAGDLPEIAIATDDAAVIAFTSGTTGYPKGAILSHGNVLATINHNTRFEDFTTRTRMLCCVPLAYTNGVIVNFLVTFGVGGTLFLEEFDPVRALELMTSAPITAMLAVPIMWESITAVPGFEEADLSALTTAVTGGAHVSKALLERWEEKGVHLRQAYALTEATANATVLPGTHFISKRDTAGIPCLHTEVRIVDDNGHDVPTGEVGEIALKGPQVFQGYWNNPEATAATLVDGWLRTGDVGALDDDGFLRIVDRKKDMIISGGLNVYPAEIERVVAGFLGVEEVAAFGVEHERWGETVALTVYGDNVDLDRLYEYCKENLSDYKVPRYLTLAREPLPRNIAGKIQRVVLRSSFDIATATRTGSS